MDQQPSAQQTQKAQEQDQPQAPGGQRVEKGLPWAKVAWASACPPLAAAQVAGRSPWSGRLAEPALTAFQMMCHYNRERGQDGKRDAFLGFFMPECELFHHIDIVKK